MILKWARLDVCLLYLNSQPCELYLAILDLVDNGSAEFIAPSQKSC